MMTPTDQPNRAAAYDPVMKTRNMWSHAKMTTRARPPVHLAHTPSGMVLAQADDVGTHRAGPVAEHQQRAREREHEERKKLNPPMHQV
jgi:hypothetical protein